MQSVAIGVGSPNDMLLLTLCEFEVGYEYTIY